MKAKLSLLLTTLTMTLSLSVAQASDYDAPEFQSAYKSYLTVSNDEGGSAKKLSSVWEVLHQADEKDPFVLVMLGSSHSLMGRDAMMPWSKMRHTEKGLEEMAIAQRLLTEKHESIYFEGMPVSLHVKTIAGITFSQVPDFFGRSEEGFYLLEDVLTDDGFHQLPAPAQTYVFYYGIVSALALDKHEQATEWQQQLEQLNVKDDFTAAAKELGAS